MYVVNKNKTVLVPLPIDGTGSDIQEGALVARGITIPNSHSVCIISAATGLDAIGLMGSKHDFSADGDTTPEDGSTKFIRRGVVLIYPGDFVAAELSFETADDIAVSSATATAITISSGEDDTDGSWVYVTGGTGAGQLQYIDAATTTVLTTDTMTTTLDNTSLIVRLMPLFHQTVHTESTRVKLASQVAAGALVWTVVKNQVSVPGNEGWVDLDPATHNGLSGLNDSIGMKLRSILAPKNTLLAPID